MQTSEAMAHIMTHHLDANGWIALCAKEDGGFKQHHYRLSELEPVLDEWPTQDVYFSQNTFYIPQRGIDTLRQLRSLYVDIDCYNRGFQPEWVLRMLELEAFRRTIPEPNLVIYSGRGLALVWNIEPEQHQGLRLWQAVQKYLFQVIHDLDVGADPKSRDAARIFRVAGSINSKSGQVVRVDFRHNFRYELQDIQANYLPELPERHGRTRCKEANQRNNQAANLYNLHSLYYNRLLDLRKLVELRDGDVKGSREKLCFYYRYWSCCFIGDAQDALAKTLQFNKSFSTPLPDSEVKRSTRSAEKAWLDRINEQKNQTARQHGFRHAGYNLRNDTVIQELGISEDEQRHMKTLIRRPEKNRRKNEKREQERREQGVLTRADYEGMRKQQVDDKLAVLAEALRINPNAKRAELAALLGVTPSRISQLKKQLDMYSRGS